MSEQRMEVEERPLTADDEVAHRAARLERRPRRVWSLLWPLKGHRQRHYYCLQTRRLAARSSRPTRGARGSVRTLSGLVSVACLVSAHRPHSAKETVPQWPPTQRDITHRKNLDSDSPFTGQRSRRRQASWPQEQLGGRGASERATVLSTPRMVHSFIGDATRRPQATAAWQTPSRASEAHRGAGHHELSW